MNKTDFIRYTKECLSGTKHDRYANSMYMSSGATAMVLGISINRVKPFMEGYPCQLGHTKLYAKTDVYEKLKRNEVLA